MYACMYATLICNETERILLIIQYIRENVNIEIKYPGYTHTCACVCVFHLAFNLLLKKLIELLHSLLQLSVRQMKKSIVFNPE